MEEAIDFSALIQSISMKLFLSDSSIHLDSTNLLQELRKGVLDSLQVGVTTDVLLLDVDVGNGALTRDLLKSILDGGTILYTKTISKTIHLRNIRHPLHRIADNAGVRSKQGFRSPIQSSKTFAHPTRRKFRRKRIGHSLAPPHLHSWYLPI